MKYVALTPIRHNGKRYLPKEPIDVDGDDAKGLLRLKAIELPAAAKPAQQQDDKGKSKLKLK